MEKQRWDDSGLAKAMKFWPLVMGLMTLVFALGIGSHTIRDVERRVSKEEVRNEAQDKQIVALEEIVKELPEMRRDIKELLRRIR